jgi:type IX secretion system PorP/SprF family membrane protein
MSYKKVNIFIILFGFAMSVFAQQDPQYSQYMYTILPFNPGYAGNAGICASLHYRQQWAGFVDIYVKDDGSEEKHKTAPRGPLVSIDGLIKGRHGLGLSIYNDALGYQNDIAIKLAYAYKINISGGSLGIGLSADFLSRSVKKNLFVPGKSGETQILALMGEYDMYVDASFGAYYRMQDKWYAGVSATHLITAIGGDKVYQSAARHFYFMGGYKYDLPSNPDWSLKPSALIKTDLSMVQLDLTLLADYNNLIWFGASYRMVDAVAVLVGARPFINFSSAIKGLEVIGSYDITTSKMLNKGASFKGRSYGGYEFCIKYCFSIVQPPKIYGYKNTKLLGNRPIVYR